MTDRELRQAYFNHLGDRALEPDDPLYVPLYEESSDVILVMKEAIDFSIGTDSVQLLSGYRGSGKSTELKRLRSLLHDSGYLVVLIDIEEHLDLHTPVDITDFLLALCGALGEALEDDSLLGRNTSKESPWDRFVNWLKSEVELPEITADVPVGATTLGLKAELRTNPTFRHQIQERLSRSLSVFNAKVRAFVSESVRALQQEYGDAPLVMLIDSIEHARGTRANEADIHASLERLFAQHDDKLKLPYVHVIYTVPPWLRIRSPGLGARYNGLYTLPEQKVHVYTPEESASPQPYLPGLALLERVVRKRIDPDHLLGSQESLNRLLLVSGGHLRDLIRLLRAVVLQARTLPASEKDTTAAIERTRAEFLPIADQDALWLAKIARTRKASLGTQGSVGDLSRFFDTHLVLCYLNGREWFDVHPLVRDIVLEQAEALQETPPAP